MNGCNDGPARRLQSSRFLEKGGRVVVGTKKAYRGIRNRGMDTVHEPSPQPVTASAPPAHQTPHIP